MAHMRSAEGYEREASLDDDPDIVYSTKKGLADADKYIESECSGNRHPGHWTNKS